MQSMEGKSGASRPPAPPSPAARGQSSCHSILLINNCFNDCLRVFVLDADWVDESSLGSAAVSGYDQAYNYCKSCPHVQRKNSCIPSSFDFLEEENLNILSENNLRRKIIL